MSEELIIKRYGLVGKTFEYQTKLGTEEALQRLEANQDGRNPRKEEFVMPINILRKSKRSLLCEISALQTMTFRSGAIKQVLTIAKATGEMQSVADGSTVRFDIGLTKTAWLITLLYPIGAALLIYNLLLVQKNYLWGAGIIFIAIFGFIYQIAVLRDSLMKLRHTARYIFK